MLSMVRILTIRIRIEMLSIAGRPALSLQPAPAASCQQQSLSNRHSQVLLTQGQPRLQVRAQQLLQQIACMTKGTGCAPCCHGCCSRGVMAVLGFPNLISQRDTPSATSQHLSAAQEHVAMAQPWPPQWQMLGLSAVQ
jgi:hypothetical protein